MASWPPTGNPTFDAAAIAATQVWQVAISAAATQAAATAADITFYQSIANTALAIGMSNALVEANRALRALNQPPVT